MARPMLATSTARSASKSAAAKFGGDKRYAAVAPVAEAFRKGKPVQAVSAPVEGAKASLMQAGAPESMATLYAEMYQGMEKGLVAFERPSAVIRGTTPLIDALEPLVG